MGDRPILPYPAPPSQLEQLAGAAEEASPTNVDYGLLRPPNPRKRKADGTPAAQRGVANLTPDQLAKKRANDREAQRAIRERTKSNIQALQRRIEELENQQPFQDLQSVLRSKDAIIAENEAMKRRLASIEALARLPAAGHGLTDLAIATAQQAPLPTTATPTRSRSDQDFTEADGPNESSVHQQHLHPDLRMLEGQGVPTAQMQSVRSPKKKNAKATSAIPIPLNSKPEHAVDVALGELITSRRTGALSGSASGHQSPSFSPLLDQDEPHSLQFSTLSAGIATIINDQLFAHTDDSVPERVAVMYIMYLLVQYLIAPSAELLERLPAFLRPTTVQMESAHNLWIDFLPWPQLRDRVISAPTPYPDTFLAATMANLSLNWPYPEDLCVMKVASATATGADLAADDNSNYISVINPVFEAHLCDLDNWTLDGTQLVRAASGGAAGVQSGEQGEKDDAEGAGQGDVVNGTDEQGEEATLEGLLQGFRGEGSA